MFKNLLLEDAEDNWSSGGHEDGDIQVSISDFDSPKIIAQIVLALEKVPLKNIAQKVEKVKKITKKMNPLSLMKRQHT